MHCREWKTNFKHWCKYCKMFVYDNKLVRDDDDFFFKKKVFFQSREGHDNNDKHKENVKRYIDDVQKRGLQLAEDEAKLKLELERIEAVRHCLCKQGGPHINKQTNTDCHRKASSKWTGGGPRPPLPGQAEGKGNLLADVW